MKLTPALAAPLALAAVLAAAAPAGAAPAKGVPAAVSSKVDHAYTVMSRINGARLPDFIQAAIAFQKAVPQACPVAYARGHLGGAIGVVASTLTTDIKAAEREDAKLYVLTRQLRGKDKAQLTGDLDAIGKSYDVVLGLSHVMSLDASEISAGKCSEAELDLTRIARHVKAYSDKLNASVLKLKLDFG